MKETHTIIIDIGNSRVKIYSFDRVFTSIDELKDYVSHEESHLRGEILHFQVFVVSTVDSKTKFLLNKLRENFQIEKETIFDHTKQEQIKNFYPEIGNDRAAKLLGASILNPGKNIILMDFGTATTISVLDSNKNFKGGFIGLGMRSSLKALGEYCDALADYSKDPELGDLIDNYDEKTIYENKSTKRAILLGAVNSHIALVNQWIYRGKQMLGTDSNIVTICTGGEAGYFERYFDRRVEEAELLKVVQSQESLQA